MNTKRKEQNAWFVSGSQHLYGEAALAQVSANSKQIADELNKGGRLPFPVEFKGVLTGDSEISILCEKASSDPSCIALITWMHTFSPAKMWIHGLQILRKPLLHLHTQFNRDIPWEKIDMDFMNLNQSAHGGREYGFMLSRLRMDRKVLAGHWQDPEVLEALSKWLRVAAARNDWQGMKVARFGDNMRDVAVTEGDKVEAQMQFGYSVSGYGVGDLVTQIDAIDQRRVDELLEIYREEYHGVQDIMSNRQYQESIRYTARIELGMRDFLEAGGFSAFTTTFEDLHGLRQLPGLAVQRLMHSGYGFGAEGDWKTAALVRAMKVMGAGLTGGTSFMEDYTYHFDPQGMMVLGAHMLEVCPSIASDKPTLQVHPLGIGGKEDPPRLVFNVPGGKGINVSLMDMGNRFRMLVNPCRVVDPKKELPNLPVARVLWQPEPGLKTAAEAWILAGGAHHTGFSMAVDTEMMQDFAEMNGIECVLIDEHTKINDLKKELRWNEIFYR